MYTLKYYGIYNQDGTRATKEDGRYLYSKEGQFLYDNDVERLRAKGYIVKVMPGYNF